MKKKQLLIIAIILLISSLCNQLLAQTPVPDKESLKFNISEDDSRFFQVTFLNQTWLRLNESNDGTTVQNKAESQTLDIGLRRTRVQMFGQITDKVFLYFQFGQNNFNSQYGINGNRKFASFFHDALCEYKVTKDNKFKIGGGLTIANGLSRFSQPSIATIMTMDVPVFLQATVDQTDEFSRKLSIIARGQIGKLDYRFSLSDPFPITSNGAALPPLNPNATFSQKGHSLQYQSYLMWQFFEHEQHNTPYMTGTYLGKKKVFNIATGIISQGNAMWKKEASSSDTVYQNMLLWSVESFLDMPLNKETGTAISAHAGYYDYNFGKNYLRYNGIMNPASGTTASNTIPNVGATFGNAFPMFGTGQIFYGQIAYLLPKKTLGSHGQLQFYASLMSTDFERLGKRMNVTNLGFNWLINGHKGKMSLNYEIRPTYYLSNGEVQSGNNKGCLVLQYQIFI